MKKQILFCIEKFCDLKPNLGWTNSFHNTINSFSRSCPQYTFDTLHLDEAQVVYGTHIDNIIIEYCLNWKVEIVIFQLLGDSSVNPSLETYRTLKKMGVYTVIVWPDTGPSHGIQTIAQIKDAVDLHVSWDVPKGAWHDQLTRESNHIDMWTPEDSSLYYPTSHKDIKASFMGSIDKYRDRIEGLQTLHAQVPDCWIGGGQRRGMLTPSQYAEVIRRSKIGINFSLSQTGVFHQAKGRIFEYTACGGLLLDNPNPCTQQFYKAGEEYVEYTSGADLVEKIKYYLANDNERERIATNGKKRFYNNWTAQHYWDQLMNRIETERSKKDGITAPATDTN